MPGAINVIQNKKKKTASTSTAKKKETAKAPAVSVGAFRQAEEADKKKNAAKIASVMKQVAKDKEKGAKQKAELLETAVNKETTKYKNQPKSSTRPASMIKAEYETDTKKSNPIQDAKGMGSFKSAERDMDLITADATKVADSKGLTAIAARMQRNRESWQAINDKTKDGKAKKERLHAENLTLAKKLGLEFNPTSGEYFKEDKSDVKFTSSEKAKDNQSDIVKGGRYGYQPEKSIAETSPFQRRAQLESVGRNLELGALDVGTNIAKFGQMVDDAPVPDWMENMRINASPGAATRTGFASMPELNSADSLAHYQEFVNAEDQKRQAAQEDAGWNDGPGSIMMEAVRAVPGTVLPLIAGLPLGELAAAAGAGGKLSAVARMVPFMASASGGYAQEAADAGAGYWDTVAYGALGGIAEGATEMVPLNSLLKVIEKAGMKNLVEKGVKKYSQDVLLQTLGSVALEAGQEAAMEPITNFNKMATYDETMTPGQIFQSKQMLRAASVGAAMAILLAPLGMAGGMAKRYVETTPADQIDIATVSTLMQQDMQDAANQQAAGTTIADDEAEAIRQQEIASRPPVTLQENIPEVVTLEDNPVTLQEDEADPQQDIMDEYRQMQSDELEGIIDDLEFQSNIFREHGLDKTTEYKNKQEQVNTIKEILAERLAQDIENGNYQVAAQAEDVAPQSTESAIPFDSSPVTDTGNGFVPDEINVPEIEESAQGEIAPETIADPYIDAMKNAYEASGNDIELLIDARGELEDNILEAQDQGKETGWMETRLDALENYIAEVDKVDTPQSQETAFPVDLTGVNNEGNVNLSEEINTPQIEENRSKEIDEELRNVEFERKEFYDEEIFLHAVEAYNDEQAKVQEAMAPLGVDVVYFTKTGGKTINGFLGKDNRVYLNDDLMGIKGITYILGHEFTHWVRSTNPDLYEEMKEVITNSDRFETTFQLYMEKRQNRTTYGDIASGDEFIDYFVEEMLADANGDIFQSKSFWETMRQYGGEFVQELRAALEQFMEYMAGIVMVGNKPMLTEAQEKQLRARLAKTIEEVEKRAKTKGIVNKYTGKRSVDAGKPTKGIKYTEEEQNLLDLMKADDETNIDDMFEQYKKIAGDIYKEQDDYLANSYGQGVEMGGIVRGDDGEVVGRYGTSSKNPAWYQKWRKEHKAAPSKAERKQLVDSVLRGEWEDYELGPKNEDYFEAQHIMDVINSIRTKQGIERRYSDDTMDTQERDDLTVDTEREVKPKEQNTKKDKDNIPDKEIKPLSYAETLVDRYSDSYKEMADTILTSIKNNGSFTYKVKPHEETMTEASEILRKYIGDNNIDSAVKWATSDGNIGSAKLIVQEVLTRIFNSKAHSLDRKGKNSEAREYYDKATDIALYAAEELKRAGQMVEAVKILGQANPVSMANKARREIDKSITKGQKEDMAANKKKVTKILEDANREAADEVADAVAKRATRRHRIKAQPRKSAKAKDETGTEKPQQEKKQRLKLSPESMIARNVYNYIKPKAEKMPDANEIEKVIKELVSSLTQSAKSKINIPITAKNATMRNLARVAAAVRSESMYTDIWDKAKTALIEEYELTPEQEDKIINYMASELIPLTVKTNMKSAWIELLAKKKIKLKDLQMMAIADQGLFNSFIDELIRDTAHGLGIVEDKQLRSFVEVMSNGVWQIIPNTGANGYAHAFANMLAKRTQDQAKESEAAQVYKMVLKSLMQSAEGKVDKGRVGNIPKTPLETVAHAITNRGMYKNIWEQAKEILKEKNLTSEQQERLSKFYDADLIPVVAEKQIRSMVKRGMSELEQAVGSVVRLHYTEYNIAKKSLTDKLVEEAGLSGEEAQILASYAAAEMDRLTGEKKKRELTSFLTTGKDKGSVAKALVERMVEWSNMGFLDSQEGREAVANKLGIAHLTDEDIRTIYHYANIAQTAQTEDERTFAMALMMKVYREKLHVSLLKKISTIQTVAQLLSLPTIERNIIGNMAMAAFSVPVDVGASVVDNMAYHICKNIFGVKYNRVNYMPTLSEFGAYWQGALKGSKNAARDVKLDIDTMGEITSSHEVNHTRIFHKTPLLNLAELGLSYSLRVPDAFFYQGRKEQLRHRMEKRLGDEVFSNADIQDMILDLSKTSVYQDDSAMATLLAKLKKDLNLGKEWGLGDIFAKYAKTSGNLFNQGLKHTPVGIVEGLVRMLLVAKHVADARKNGSEISSQEMMMMAQVLSKGVMGTAVLGSIGFILGAAGVAYGMPPEQKDVAAQEKNMGKLKYSLNWSALLRWAESGCKEKQEITEGDWIVSYDWVLPLSMPFAIGVELSNPLRAEKYEKGLTQNSAMYEAMNAGRYVAEFYGIGAQLMSEQAVFQGIKNFMAYGDFSKGGSQLVSSIPASFMPQELNRIRNYIDNTKRDSKGMYGLAINKLPFAEKSLNEMKDPYGETGEVYSNAGNSFFNTQVNPSFTYRYQPTKLEKMTYDAYKETGDSAIIPNTADRYLQSNGQRWNLTSDEYLFFSALKGAIYSDMLEKNDNKDKLKDLPGDAQSEAKQLMITKYGDRRGKLAQMTGTHISQFKQDYMGMNDQIKVPKNIMEAKEAADAKKKKKSSNQYANKYKRKVSKYKKG